MKLTQNIRTLETVDMHTFGVCQTRQ